MGPDPPVACRRHDRRRQARIKEAATTATRWPHWSPSRGTTSAPGDHRLRAG